MQRVDIDKDGRGCHTVWTTNVQAPSVVPKLSLRQRARLHVHDRAAEERPRGTSRRSTSGRASGSQPLRRAPGFGYNNNYAPITIGPDGTAYVGVLGGLVSFRDSR